MPLGRWAPCDSVWRRRSITPKPPVCATNWLKLRVRNNSPPAFPRPSRPQLRKEPGGPLFGSRRSSEHNLRAQFAAAQHRSLRGLPGRTAGRRSHFYTALGPPPRGNRLRKLVFNVGVQLLDGVHTIVLTKGFEQKMGEV